jgi:hypothetical protein
LSTKQDWIRDLVEQDCLFEALVVCRLTRIEPASVKTSRGRNLLFSAQSRQAIHLLVTVFGVNPNEASDEVRSRCAVTRPPMSPVHQGTTPLFRPANDEACAALLEHGANANWHNNGGSSPLFFASSMMVTRLLLDHGASSAHVNSYKHTPLHLAASHGRRDTPSAASP